MDRTESVIEHAERICSDHGYPTSPAPEIYIPLPGAAAQVDRPWSFEEMAALDMDQPMYYSRERRIHLMLTGKDDSPTRRKWDAECAEITRERIAADSRREAFLARFTEQLKASIALEIEKDGE